MAYPNQREKTPECLTDLYDYIERNTGLCGHDNPGKAHLSASGTTLMITSDRTSFDYQGVLLEHIETTPELRIKHIGIKKGRDHTRPYLEVVEA